MLERAENLSTVLILSLSVPFLTLRDFGEASVVNGDVIIISIVILNNVEQCYMYLEVICTAYLVHPLTVRGRFHFLYFVNKVYEVEGILINITKNKRVFFLTLTAFGMGFICILSKQKVRWSMT